MPTFTSATTTVAPAATTTQTPAIETVLTSTTNTTTGCVKWFNNKAGYGFITVNDCDTNEPRDMFVHHTAIQVGQSQYKYLVQGEYVEFVITPSDNTTHVLQATAVRGVNGGKLMCETRNEMRSVREEHHQQVQPKQQQQQQQTSAPASKFQRTSSSVPQRQRETVSKPPQLSKSDETEWMIVPRRKTTTSSAPAGGKRTRPQQRQPAVELASA
jgi:CspA family cold shock protein